MKKIVVPLLSVSLPKEPVTLTLWHNYGGQMKNTMDEMIDEFNETIGVEKELLLMLLLYFLEQDNSDYVFMKELLLMLLLYPAPQPFMKS